MDNKEREKSALGRFEIIAESYTYATEVERQIVLRFLSNRKQETFLNAVGLYHLFTDQYFYEKVRDTVGKQIYKDLHK